MPGVKKLHQQSESNTKPKYIFGHSCQAIAVLTQALSTVFAVPLACRIHEGVVFPNRDKRTLLDKMIILIDSLGMSEPFYLVADAYYANQYLHRKSEDYRNAVRRKIAAYHRHIQLGLIAQGLLQILSATIPKTMWRSFGSWIRTIRPGLAPSEQVAAIAMRHALPEFIASAAKTSIFVKFLRHRIDLSRTEGVRLAA